MSSNFRHEAVLKKEAIDALLIKPDGLYIDATFGRGGHSAAILDLLGKDGKLIAIDRDPEAVAAATELQFIDSRLQACLLYTSPSPRDLSTSRMPSSA